MSDQPGLLTVAEVAHRLGVGPAQVARRAKARGVTGTKHKGRILFTPADLDKLIGARPPGRRPQVKTILPYPRVCVSRNTVTPAQWEPVPLGSTLLHVRKRELEAAGDVCLVTGGTLWRQVTPERPVVDG